MIFEDRLGNSLEIVKHINGDFILSVKSPLLDGATCHITLTWEEVKRLADWIPTQAPPAPDPPKRWR